MTAANGRAVFIKVNRIDLRVGAGLGKDYESSTIAYKLYAKGSIPDDEKIVEDLEGILKAYDAYLENQEAASTEPVMAGNRAWIFQANPIFYDIDGALDELDNISRLVKKHANEIKIDDRVFIWKFGQNRGIVATRIISTNPGILDIDLNENKFNVTDEKFPEDQIRSVVSIELQLKPAISREQILSDTRLVNLSIIRAPQA